MAGAAPATLHGGGTGRSVFTYLVKMGTERGRESDQKVMSVPLGPVEIASQWYAHNRLGVTTLISQTWGCGIDGPSPPGEPCRVSHITLSRVIEKPALLSTILVKGVIEDVFGPALRAGRLQGLCLISDCGRHFFSQRFLDFTLFQVPDTYRVNTSTNFGLQYHLKSCCDGIGGTLHTYRREYCLKNEIGDLIDLKRCYDVVSQRSSELSPTIPRMMCSIVMPESKGACEARLKRLEKPSMPCKISAAHEFQSVINDRRLVECPTRSLVGRNNQLSGLNISANKVCGDACTRIMCAGSGAAVRLAADQAEHVESDPDEEAQQRAEDLFIDQHTAEHNGWRVSFRKSKVEQLSIEQVKGRLSSTWANFKDYSSGFGQRHNPVDHHKKITQKRKQADKAKVKRDNLKAFKTKEAVD